MSKGKIYSYRGENHFGFQNLFAEVRKHEDIKQSQLKRALAHVDDVEKAIELVYSEYPYDYDNKKYNSLVKLRKAVVEKIGQNITQLMFNETIGLTNTVEEAIELALSRARRIEKFDFQGQKLTAREIYPSVAHRMQSRYENFASMLRIVKDVEEAIKRINAYNHRQKEYEYDGEVYFGLDNAYKAVAHLIPISRSYFKAQMKEHETIANVIALYANREEFEFILDGKTHHTRRSVFEAIRDKIKIGYPAFCRLYAELGDMQQAIDEATEGSLSKEKFAIEYKGKRYKSLPDFYSKHHIRMAFNTFQKYYHQNGKDIEALMLLDSQPPAYELRGEGFYTKRDLFKSIESEIDLKESHFMTMAAKLGSYDAALDYALAQKQAKQAEALVYEGQTYKTKKDLYRALPYPKKTYAIYLGYFPKMGSAKQVIERTLITGQEVDSFFLYQGKLYADIFEIYDAISEQIKHICLYDFLEIAQAKTSIEQIIEAVSKRNIALYHAGVGYFHIRSFWHSHGKSLHLSEREFLQRYKETSDLDLVLSESKKAGQKFEYEGRYYATCVAFYLAVQDIISVDVTNFNKILKRFPTIEEAMNYMIEKARPKYFYNGLEACTKAEMYRLLEPLLFCSFEAFKIHWSKYGLQEAVERCIKNDDICYEYEGVDYKNLTQAYYAVTEDYSVTFRTFYRRVHETRSVESAVDIIRLEHKEIYHYQDKTYPSLYALYEDNYQDIPLTYTTFIDHYAELQCIDKVIARAQETVFRVVYKGEEYRHKRALADQLVIDFDISRYVLMDMLVNFQDIDTLIADIEQKIKENESKTIEYNGVQYANATELYEAYRLVTKIPKNTFYKILANSENIDIAMERAQNRNLKVYRYLNDDYYCIADLHNEVSKDHDINYTSLCRIVSTQEPVEQALKDFYLSRSCHNCAFVYLIRMKVQGQYVYKIGQTARGIMSRMRDDLVSDHYRTVHQGLSTKKKVDLVEAELHELMKHKRNHSIRQESVKGGGYTEMFDLDKQDVRFVMQYMNERLIQLNDDQRAVFRYGRYKDIKESIKETVQTL